MIGSEVERAMQYAMSVFSETEITEFTVAPQVTPNEGLPHHEWWIAFAKKPNNVAFFAKELDMKMRQLNVYYDDLIKGNILKPLVIKALAPDAFIQYMKSQGKLGGQNKVPRLSNTRDLVKDLEKWIAEE